jgi:hypothetical protein
MFYKLAKDGDHKLFNEVPENIKDGEHVLPEWIPYLPVGTFKHPKYGDLKFDNERNSRFVDNFRNKVYQETIPVDAEHQGKISGAMAQITEMRQNENGSVDAKVNWTERGRKLMEGKAFRYFSPEFFAKWQDNATGVEHQDVATGGALTNRPFFKDSALRPIISMSEGCFYESKREGDEIHLYPLEKEQEEKTMTDEKKDERLAQFHELSDEEQLAMLTQAGEVAAENEELKGQIETIKASEAEKEERIDVLSKKVDKMVDDERTRRFTDIVKHADNPWYGEQEKHVNMLTKLAEAFGEDSDEFKGYIEGQNATAEQLAKSELFKEVGDGEKGGNATDADKVHTLAEKRAEEKKISLADALTEVMNENPSFYTEDKEATEVKV